MEVRAVHDDVVVRNSGITSFSVIVDVRGDKSSSRSHSAVEITIDGDSDLPPASDCICYDGVSALNSNSDIPKAAYRTGCR